MSSLPAQGLFLDPRRVASRPSSRRPVDPRAVAVHPRPGGTVGPSPQTPPHKVDSLPGDPLLPTGPLDMGRKKMALAPRDLPAAPPAVFPAAQLPLVARPLDAEDPAGHHLETRPLGLSREAHPLT